MWIVYILLLVVVQLVVLAVLTIVICKTFVSLTNLFFVCADYGCGLHMFFVRKFVSLTKSTASRAYYSLL